MKAGVKQVHAKTTQEIIVNFSMEELGRLVLPQLPLEEKEIQSFKTTQIDIRNHDTFVFKFLREFNGLCLEKS